MNIQVRLGCKNCRCHSSLKECPKKKFKICCSVWRLINVEKSTTKVTSQIFCNAGKKVTVKEPLAHTLFHNIQLHNHKRLMSHKENSLFFFKIKCINKLRQQKSENTCLNENTVIQNYIYIVVLAMNSVKITRLYVVICTVH